MVGKSFLKGFVILVGISMTIKVMFDTNIYDKIQADKQARECLERLVLSNTLEVLTTHIQEDELQGRREGEVPKERVPTEGFILGVSRLGKAKLGDGSEPVSGDLNEKKVPTAGAIWGVSKWGEGTYGDGSQSGISLSDIQTSEGNHARDALIATTASANANIFVTEDKRLFNRMNKLPAKCRVYTFEQFREYLNKLEG